MTPQVGYFRSFAQCCRDLADFITHCAGENIARKGAFSWVLTGGGTPKTLYELVARPPYADKIDWRRTHLFWGDDRFLPADHKDSNYRLAYESMIRHIPIPEDHVHPMPTTAASPLEGARAYEREICRFFGLDLPPRLNPDTEFPGFDLMLLGVGNDGHIASLFPGRGSLESKRMVTAESAAIGSPTVARISLTLPVINQSRDIVFLVRGAAKRKILDTVLKDPTAAKAKYPVARVRARNRLKWFVGP